MNYYCDPRIYHSNIHQLSSDHDSPSNPFTTTKNLKNHYHQQSLSPHSSSFQSSIHWVDNNTNNTFTSKTIKANMIKTGIYSDIKENYLKPQKPSSCGYMSKIIFGSIIIFFPMMILLYFLAFNPLSKLYVNDKEKIIFQDPNFRSSSDSSSESISHQILIDDDSPSIVVYTNYGPIEGKISVAMNLNVYTFLGIPYAEPPIGKLRFHKPVRVKPWKTLKITRKLSPPCFQEGIEHNLAIEQWVSKSVSSEDCLYLNIWTTSYLNNTNSSNKNKNDKDINNTEYKLKPVMLWIHGGGFITGSSDISLYDGTILSAYGDVVIVSFNYRLSVFGFLNLEIDDAPGNQGLYDQVSVLEWIQENIATFGGDPNQVTIFGESAGAFSVGFHLLSPLSKNLFKRAILQSGSPFYPQVFEAKSLIRERTITFAQKLECISSDGDEIVFNKKLAIDILECLQRIDPEKLIELSSSMMYSLRPSFSVTIGNTFLPLDPYELSRQITSLKDILIGTNNDEGSIFLHLLFPDIYTIDNPKNLTKKDIIPLVNNAFKLLPPPGPHLINHFFLLSDNDASPEKLRNVFYETIGDFIITCPVVFFIQELASVYAKLLSTSTSLASSTNNAVIYQYLFTHRPSNSKLGSWMGVSHFDEVQFVFGRPFYKPNDYTREELELSARMMETWILFARLGKVPTQLGKEWPLYRLEEKSYMEINVKSSKIGVGPHENNCNLWRLMFQTVATLK